MSFASKMRFLLFFFSESPDAPQAPPPRQSTPYGKLDLTNFSRPENWLAKVIRANQTISVYLKLRE